MWLFLTGMWANRIARKIIIYGAAGLAIFWLVRLWSNRVYSEGYKSGKAAGLTDVEESKKAEWKAKESAIAAEAGKVAADSKALSARRTQLDADASALRSMRQRNEDALSKAMAEIRAGREVQHEADGRLAGGELVDTIRAVSAKLAAEPTPVK